MPGGAMHIRRIYDIEFPSLAEDEVREEENKGEKKHTL